MAIDETPRAPTPSSPISLPSNYDLITGQTCSFLVNVASNMADQWINAGSPSPSTNFWIPQDPCPVTSSKFDVSKCSFGDLIWSTFQYKDTSYTEPFGFTATYNGNTYLVFRGSKTKVDFEIDAETLFTDYSPPTPDAQSNLEVQQGFYTVYKGLLEPLQQALRNLPDSSTPLTITGHSLGSALATLAVPEAVSNQTIVQQYNQASPAVGDPDFALYY